MRRYAGNVIRGILLAAAFCVLFATGNDSAVGAYADTDTFSYEGIIYEIEADTGEAVVCGAEENMQVLEIPEVIFADGKEYAVTGIQKTAFALDSELTKVTIPDSCREIGEGAFYKCTALGEVSFGEDSGLNYIGAAAFAYSGVEELILPDSLLEIGQSAFYKASELNVIHIGKETNKIGVGAFSYCSNIYSFSVDEDNSCFTVEADILYNHDKTNLISGIAAYGSVELYAGVKTIGEYAFEGNCYITEIVCPEGMKEIKGGAFLCCERLERIIIPSTADNIAYKALAYCNSLSAIKVSEENEAYKSEGGMLLTKDGQILISYPAAKGSIVIPDGVKYIAKWAFCGNDGITSVEIPAGVKKIFDGAFYDCNNLSYVKFYSLKTKLSDASETAGFCGIFHNTARFMEINLPYSKNAGQEGSLEALLEGHCDEEVIFTNN